jgi:hypothetical protein
MAAPEYSIEAARSLLNEADDLLSDARRIAGIADSIEDRALGNALKEEVRTLVFRAQQISELARSLSRRSEGPLRKGL